MSIMKTITYMWFMVFSGPIRPRRSQLCDSLATLYGDQGQAGKQGSSTGLIQVQSSHNLILMAAGNDFGVVRKNCRYCTFWPRRLQKVHGSIVSITCGKT